MRSSSFEKTAQEITNVSTVHVDVLKQEIAQAIEQNFPGTTEVHLTKCASNKGVNFRDGIIVAHGSTSGLPDFGAIVQICIVQKRLCFMVRRLSGWYREHFRAFELSVCPARETVLIEFGELADDHPLADYFVGPLQMVTIKVIFNSTFGLHVEWFFCTLIALLKFYSC